MGRGCGRATAAAPRTAPLWAWPRRRSRSGRPRALPGRSLRWWAPLTRRLPTLTCSSTAGGKGRIRRVRAAVAAMGAGAGAVHHFLLPCFAGRWKRRSRRCRRGCGPKWRRRAEPGRISGPRTTCTAKWSSSSFTRPRPPSRRRRRRRRRLWTRQARQLVSARRAEALYEASPAKDVAAAGQEGGRVRRCGEADGALLSSRLGLAARNALGYLRVERHRRG
mmetsp:Transcript_32846/g.74152  ORF Transcript_32846/g.74152 Transcript_32846/m.74152 type:complete len:221 (-) Transcript_32846:80-742(-)